MSFHLEYDPAGTESIDTEIVKDNRHRKAKSDCSTTGIPTAVPSSQYLVLLMDSISFNGSSSGSVASNSLSPSISWIISEESVLANLLASISHP
jgi:hypothetical protein